MNKKWERTHIVKIDRCYFENVSSGRKRFEIRYDDRDYQVGDWLILDCSEITSKIACKIIYKTTYQQKEGYCVLGFTIGDKND